MSKDYKEIMEQYLNDPNIFKISSKELRERQSEMLKACFKHHYENCTDYRKYCDAKNVNPSMINSLDDAHMIPLLDSAETLRKRQFLSVPENEITAKFSSTGTSGKPVLWCFRDDTSVEWQGITAIRMASEVADIKAGESLIMIPDMPNLPFCQILKNYLPKAGHEITIGLNFEMKDGKPNVFPDTEKIINFFKSPTKPKNLFGYPFTIAQLKDLLDSKGIKADIGENGTVMTAGGWKAKAKTMAYASYQRPELEELLSETFRMPIENIRDVYGATELVNSCWECLYNKDGKTMKNKHVPPWMYLLVLNPDTLEPLKTGEIGRAAFLDFACYSHPDFILTDDMVRIISNDGCECGRSGQTIEFIDRVKELGERGCAFIVRDKLFSEEYLKQEISEAGKEKMDEKRETGVLEYVKEQRKDVDGDFIRGNVGDMTAAMEAVVEVFKLIRADESLLEALDIVDLGKNLCYKTGEPAVLDLEDLIKKTPNISRDRILELVDKLERAELLIKKEHDGKVTIQMTKKADELGEALYPMILWALKWSKKEQKALS